MRSIDDYRALQRYIAAIAVDEIERRGIALETCAVLELGAGPGGYSQVLHERGGSLLASDIERDPLFTDRRIPFQEIDVLARFPLPAAAFDLVFCSNLIEHLARPSAMLAECFRVLRPGGRLYLSFPPFYSLLLIGGHQFKPFHLLGERLAVHMLNWRQGTDVRDYASCYGTFGLHPLTIRRVRDLIITAGFRIECVYTRASPINTATWPWILKDLLTWHVCFLARAPGSHDGYAEGSGPGERAPRSSGA